MQVTARKFGRLSALLAGFVLMAAPMGGQTDGQAIALIAQLASSLSQNDAPGALSLFDAGTKDYGRIEANLSALMAQTDVLCALDVVGEKDENSVHSLDVDWYMSLHSQADGGLTERRRMRVQIRLKTAGGRIKIVSLTPIEIFDPLHIN